MADVYWVGGAAAVAQVSAANVTSYDATTTYKLTVGGSNGAPAVVITAIAAGSAAATAAALAAAWNLSTHPYLDGITATVVSSTSVQLTADDAGVPFVVTSSVSGGSGTFGAVSATTASSGPNDWSTAANWSAGSVPANGDKVYLRNSNIPILWGLGQSAVTPALFVREQTYTGQVGLPLGEFTTTGPGTYDNTVPEYRQSYLALGAASWQIGASYGGGSSGNPSTGPALEKYDGGTTQATWIVLATGVAGITQLPCYIKNTNASSTAEVYGGKVGFCWETPGDTGQFAGITCFGSAGGGSGGSNPFGGSSGSSGGGVFIGKGVTVALVDVPAGNVTTAAIPGTLTIEASASVQMANVSAGTITLMAMRGDFTPGPVAVAVGALSV